MVVQTFIRWSRLGVWERLPAMTQERSVALGMAFLDGTAIRAHAGGWRSGGRCFSLVLSHGSVSGGL
jgi:hypothetical protein